MVEDTFEKEFNKRYPLAVANVARIRKATPAKSPAEVLDVLAKEFSSAERNYGSDAGKFIDASAPYVLSAVEVHGTQVKNLRARNALVNVVIVGGNPTVRAVAPVIAIGIAMLNKRFRALAGAAAVAAPVADFAKNKLDTARNLANKVNIKEPGKRSIGWAVVRVTRSILGTAPVRWPAAPKTAPAKASAKAPAKAAAKPAAKKPVAKPAAKRPAAKSKA
jgi:phosphohistidine phosphatase SixA